MNKNSVSHFEIYGDNPEKLQKFYSSLFDRKIQDMPEMDYKWIETVETDDKGMPTQPGGINGGMMKRPPGFESNAWVNYVNVDSLEASVERAKKLGATVMKPKAPVPGYGWFAILSDPQGNTFAMWQTDPEAK
jgi:uncharacterized protein